MNLPAFEPRVTWTPPRLSDLPSWGGAGRIAYDLETCDPQLRELGPGVRRGGYITGFAFAIEDGPSYYLPIAHEGGDNLPKEQVLSYVRDNARAFTGELVGANLPYDLDYSAEVGIEFNPSWYRDVQIAEPLLDELATSFSLDNILKRHGFGGKLEDGIGAAYSYYGLDKSMMWRLPGRHVAHYAEGDVTEPLKVLRRQERKLEAEGLWDIYNLESRLLPVLLRMRRRGVRIDFDRLDQVEKWALAREVEALKEVTRLTGVQLATEDTTRPAVLEPCLVAIGIKVPRTPKSNQPSLSNEFLEEIDNPVAKHLVVAKKFNKLRGTFVKSIRTHAIGDRIHCSFHQMRTAREGSSDEKGTRYGRLSCTDPNLQQQPARDPEIGPVWRKIYVPDDGGEWACMDYSQQEPRWAVHFAETSALTGKPRWSDEARAAAVAAAEAYRNDPTTDAHNMTSRMINAGWDDLPKEEKKLIRNGAKDTFLGLIYGMGEVTLCRKLNFPTKTVKHWRTGKPIEVAGDEGQAFFRLFHERVPYISELSDRAERMARKNGYIRTVLRRKCRFPTDERGRYDWVHKAGNRLVQGSSGDQTKKAMIDADDDGVRLQLQVHDELAHTIWGRHQAEECAEIMVNAVPCRVPHYVTIKIGPSWGEVK